MHALVRIATRNLRLASSPILPSARTCGAQQVRCFTLARKGLPKTAYSKTHRLGTDGLAELRFMLARDNLKQYTEGDRREEILNLALDDNKAARALKSDTKYFLQLLEILCAGKRFREIIDEVDANIFVYNNNTAILEYRAHAYMRLGIFDKALDDTVYILVNYRTEDRDAEELYQQKADCEIALERFDKAYETCKTCLERGIVLDKALQLVVDHLNNVPEILKVLDTEIGKSKERNAPLLLCRAYFLSQRGEPALALADYNAAPDCDKKADFFFDYGNILAKLNRPEEEIYILQRAMGTNHDDLDLREFIMQKQFFLFQFERILKTAEDAKPLGKIRPPATHYLGEALLMSGDYRNAIEQFSLSIDSKKESDAKVVEEGREEDIDMEASDTVVLAGIQRSYFARAMCHVALGNNEQALADLTTLAHHDLAKQTLNRMLLEKERQDSSTTMRDFASLEQAGLEYFSGIHKREHKKYDEAVIHFSNALECELLNHFPFNMLKLNILLGRATCYEPLRRYTEALQDCDAILELFTSDNKQVFNVQQSCLASVEKYDDIAGILRKYHLLNDPKDYESAHLSLAMAYANATQHQKSYDELHKCEHQSTLEWQKLLCDVTHELYKAEEAIAATTNFLKRADISDEERGYALLLRAENYVRCLQKEKYNDTYKKVYVEATVAKILQDIQTSIATYPDGEEDALQLRAHVYYTFTKQYGKAIENFSKLSNQMKATLGVARCLKAMNKPEEATKHLEKLLQHTEKITNGGGDVMAFRGSVLYQLGKYEDAITNYSMGILLNQHDDQFVANCYHQRAEAYLQLGDTKQAENDLKRAVELNPGKKEEYLQLELQFKKEEDCVQLVQ